ncbi:Holliday junction resolvase RuvX [Chlamydia sp.]|uniref:Holliday junction resolvase RuvX n=1 Tax=Chlamydia sp. TaxID=35827 RepID=UPI0025C3A3D1|nr:Holliday junction resolvase RuvX [Chlamydia sp.]MBQ8498380.1 Holliday junction resolvase RuvX [Chlamydia sp.]
MNSFKQKEAFLGVDYGKKRTGLAFASAPLFVTLPIGFIETRPSLAQTAESLITIIKERAITTVVFGNPLPMQKAYASSVQQEIQELATLIQEKLPLEVILWDERLSSAQAERMLKSDCGLNRKQRKSSSDTLAATIILSNFLDSRKLY